MNSQLDKQLNILTENTLKQLDFKNTFVNTLNTYIPTLESLAKAGRAHYYFETRKFQRKLLKQIVDNVGLDAFNKIVDQELDINTSIPRVDLEISHYYPLDNLMLQQFVKSYVENVWHLNAEEDCNDLIISWNISLID